MKSSTKEIKERFDNDVERFANLDTGQVSTIDALVSLELITDAAARVNPKAANLLDVGCGAGNYTITMLSKIPGMACTLVDLSLPMLERAENRLQSYETSGVTTIQGDIRTAALPEEHFDIILAGAVLHHLREDSDWESVFNKLFSLLVPGGSLWISDLVLQESEEITKVIWDKYGDYLENYGGKEYRGKVLDYIEKEDSPRSLTYQLDLLKKTGFQTVEVLHKNLCFAAFGAIKQRE